MKYKNKIDLHLHFDGSLPLATAWKLLKKRPNALPITTYEELEKRMKLDEHCHSLYDYLNRFDTSLALLQEREMLVIAAHDLVIELADQGLLYAEIRFAPQQHIKQGLSQEEVFLSIHKGIQKALEETNHIRVNLIVCMMILGDESITHEENLKTLALAKKYHGKGIVALDLAGAEGMGEMKDFAPFFHAASKAGIPFTIHAGESFGAGNVKTAIELGAKRIGHGTRSYEDEDVLRLLKEKQIPLEVCISSNVDCEVVTSYAAHPVHFYMSYGIPITINTDNMTISDTTLEKEAAWLLKEQGFQEEDILRCNMTAIQHAFISEEEKSYLQSKYVNCSE